MPEQSNKLNYNGEIFPNPSNGADHSSIIHGTNGDRDSITVSPCPPLFFGVLSSDYAKISAAARVKEFTRGEILFMAGEAIQHLSLVTSGLVKTTQVGMHGAEVILRLNRPGDVLGVVSLFSTGRHARTAEAFRSCRVVEWDISTFKNLVNRFPVLQQNMVRILGQHLQELEERFHEVATEKVGLRVARQLLRLGQQIGSPVNGKVDISLSQGELAQMTGTTLFTVSRVLSGWESRGWVRCRREAVTICDVQALLVISE